MKLKKALIFGITGQDGSYLSEFLLKKNYIVHGVIRRSSAPNTQRIDHLINSKNEKKLNRFNLHYGDLSDTLSIFKILESIKPDEVYNLAAQSHVKVSFEIPEYTYDVVGTGTLRILECIRQLRLKKCKFLQASSSEMYGNSLEIPQNEMTKFSPQSPYASAKVLAYWTTRNYRDNHKIFASNSIMFNHESPRRGVNFVTKKIVRGLCSYKLGKQKNLILGNLDAKRDWGYAKEYCEMFWKILQHDKPDDFVVATNKSYSVRDFIEITCNELKINLKWIGKGLNEKGINKNNKKVIINLSPKYFRKGEVNFLQGDYSKSLKILKWKPKIDLKKLVKIMILEEMKYLKESKFY